MLLTEPLVLTYNAMIRLPHHNHTQITMPTNVSQSSKHHIASLFPQNPTSTDKSSLTAIHSYTQQHPYTYSDSAFSLTDVEVGIY